MQDSDCLSILQYAFVSWVSKVRRVQSDMISSFDLIVDHYKIGGKKSASILVNSAAYWAGVADIARTLTSTAEHFSRECNKMSGYQLDMGELEDVFRQQHEWNKKHLGTEDIKSS